jgi:CDP-diacylglycerol--glycerol-3-phosphate 3-phosphatidyltransferase
LGARLDPLTDKILISAPLLWLGATDLLPLWAVWLLLGRELLISGWRAGQGSGGPASKAGKAKTILQFASLLLLLWPCDWGLGAQRPWRWWIGCIGAASCCSGPPCCWPWAPRGATWAPGPAPARPRQHRARPQANRASSPLKSGVLAGLGA